MERKPIQKTLTFSPEVGQEDSWEAILPATNGVLCCECRKDAESILLELTVRNGCGYYDAKALCKQDLDARLEAINRYKECVSDVGGVNEKADKCWDRKTNAEGGFSHRGMADAEES